MNTYTTVQQYRRIDDVFAGDFIHAQFPGEGSRVWVKVLGNDVHDRCCRRLLVRDRGVSRFLILSNSLCLDTQRDVAL